MRKQHLIGIIVISIAAGTTIGLMLPGLLNSSNNPFDPNSPVDPFNPPTEDENAMIVLSSGTYTGLCLYAKNVIVPAGQTVIFQNAEVLGGEIYVFGTLSVQSSKLDHEIRVHDNGIVSLNDTQDVAGNVNYTYVWVYTYDTAQITVTGNSRIYLNAN
ncbi:MAG: hypothetical protein GYA24_02770, partial [Candidatus Lokiarchaeota archaeon]|nr:hypothetical protein [Candidatus Lokiarchaeota archaeon]